MWAFSPVDLCGGQKTSTFSHDLNLNCVETKTKHCTIKKTDMGIVLEREVANPDIEIKIEIIYRICSQMPCSRQA